MYHPRVIPCLLLKGEGLYKTVKFRSPRYVGDPRNAVKIFNEKEVDELMILDIAATPEKRAPQIDLIREIVSEAFMPVAYGGGIRNLEDARKILAQGVEKIVLNTIAMENPEFVSEAAASFGSQSVVVSIDVRKKMFGKYEVFSYGGRKGGGLSPVEYAVNVTQLGAGELLLNSIDRDGTMAGYDISLLEMVTNAVNVPVVACGGAGSIDDLGQAVKNGGASAAVAGSLFVFYGKHRSVLINYPEQKDLKNIFS